MTNYNYKLVKQKLIQTSQDIPVVNNISELHVLKRFFAKKKHDSGAKVITRADLLAAAEENHKKQKRRSKSKPVQSTLVPSNHSVVTQGSYNNASHANFQLDFDTSIMITPKS